MRLAGKTRAAISLKVNIPLLLSSKARNILLCRSNSIYIPILSQEAVWDNQLCPRCYTHNYESDKLIANMKAKYEGKSMPYPNPHDLTAVHLTYTCKNKYCQHKYKRIEDHSE